MSDEETIGRILSANRLTISTVESCTGGLLSSKLTDVAGSSSYVRLNFVTYCNEAKHNILGVSNTTLNRFGAVSQECSIEMAQGLGNITGSDICISTTGTAGPSGADGHPAGVMYSTICGLNCQKSFAVNLPADTPRIRMKEKFAAAALKELVKFLQSAGLSA
ncbi:MAG: CinA family protein [Alphaproteobacteria bacterium]|nr:CinA family protein [Alphaproteobacteria bacterium]